jgi:hypothetical protein
MSTATANEAGELSNSPSYRSSSVGPLDLKHMRTRTIVPSPTTAASRRRTGTSPFSQAEERLWVGSRNAFNARVGRLVPFSALRLHAETPLTDPKRTGVPDGSGSLLSQYNKISLRW